MTLKRSTRKSKYHDPSKTTDAEVMEHLAKVTAKTMKIDSVEATKRVYNLVSSGLVFRFKEGSEEAAIFTDHFLMIPSSEYERINSLHTQFTKNQ